MHTLISLMAEDITFWSDGGGKATAIRYPLQGRQKVVRFLIAIRKSRLIPDLTSQLTLINNESGIINLVEGAVQSTFSFDWSGQTIQAIFAVVNPEKLTDAKQIYGCCSSDAHSDR